MMRAGSWEKSTCGIHEYIPKTGFLGTEARVGSLSVSDMAMNIL